MVVNTIGDTNNGTGACSQMRKTVIATIEICLMKSTLKNSVITSNYIRYLFLSNSFNSLKCVYLQPRDVHRSISKMVKTVALQYYIFKTSSEFGREVWFLLIND